MPEENIETENSAGEAEKKKTPLEMIKERQAAQRESRGGQKRGGTSDGGVKANASGHSTKPTMPLKTGNKGA